MLFLIILILCFTAGFVLPWWAVAVIAFLTALIIGKKAAFSFLMSFLAVAAAWVVLALFKTIPNDNILAARVAKLVGLPGWGYLLLITALIGGLVGGLAALSGAFTRQAFAQNKKA